MRLVAVAVLALAACETPNARIVYELATGDSQGCGSADCADIKIPCDAVISIRILRPTDPTAPLVTICEPVPQTARKDLCSIAGIDLGSAPIELPKETLEVQVVIWDREHATNPATDALDCQRHEVRFDAVGGFPIAQTPSPAIGGHAFYHPGDEEIRVVLGCTDLRALQACVVDETITVTASVESFENLGVTVSLNEANQFDVSVGEPTQKGAAAVHSLDLDDIERLTLTSLNQVIPFWTKDVGLLFTDIACVQVFENSAQATGALRCETEGVPPAPGDEQKLDLQGIQLPKATVDQVLAALGLAAFPETGLTVGIVVDELFNPVAGEVVTAVVPDMTPPATIRYLSANRSTFSGTVTTTSGIFVSLDAAFGSRFSVDGSATEIGGLVEGKVTVVVIQK